MSVYLSEGIAITNDGKEYDLTKQEIKVLRAIKRLEKMDFGRLELFGNGLLQVRMGKWYCDEIETTSIRCEGGDGGD